MPNKLKALLIVVLCLPLVGAWPNTGKKYPPTTTYSGPGNVVSGAAAWWGIRAYSSSQIAGTTKSINLARSSDSHTCDVLINTSGNLGNTANCSNSGDNGTAVATWCNATTCNVTEWYDQSGNGLNIFQATSADQWPITFSCVNSQACIGPAPSTSDPAYSNTTTSINQPVTISAMSERTTNSAVYGRILDSNGGSGFCACYVSSGANTVLAFAGSTAATATASDNSFHALQFEINGASSNINVDGTNTSVSSGTQNGNTHIQLGNDTPTATNGLLGNVSEVGFWLSALNTTQQGNLCHNQRLYYATGGSC